MDSSLSSYLTLRYASEGERAYIHGLLAQYEKAENSESYHLALFAYHLLFICFLYQVIFKMKLWIPDKHHTAMVSFNSELRKKFRGAISPTDYADPKNNERSFFEFLNIFSDCEDIVSECKKLIDYRNQRLGHVNYLLVNAAEYSKKIAEYNAVAVKIQSLTHDELKRVFAEYVENTDVSSGLNKDDVELGLIIPNRLSGQDLGIISGFCRPKGDLVSVEIYNILYNDFSIGIE